MTRKKNDYDVCLLVVTDDVIHYALRLLHRELSNAGYRTKSLFIIKEIGESLSDKELRDITDFCKEVTICGISVTSSYLKPSELIGKKLKESVGQDIHICWGGVHPTSMPEIIDDYDFLDSLCVGDGEEAIVALAKQVIREKRPVEKISGIAGIKTKAAKGDSVGNLKPFNADFTLAYPENTHVYLMKGFYEIYDDQIQNKYFKNYYTITSRGCPYSCTYCINSSINKMYPQLASLRFRSAENLLKELEYAQSKFSHLEKIVVDDDGFFAQKKEFYSKLSSGLKNLKDIPLQTMSVHPNKIDDAMIDFFKQIRINKVRIGVQSASPKTLKRYKRGYQKNEQVVKAIHLLKDARIKILIDIIIDNPDEEDRDRITSLNFFNSLPKPFQLNVYSLIYYPGTDQYNDAISNNFSHEILAEKYMTHYNKPSHSLESGIWHLLSYRTKRGLGLPPLVKIFISENSFNPLIRVPLFFYYQMYKFQEMGSVFFVRIRLFMKYLQSGNLEYIKRRLLSFVYNR